MLTPQEVAERTFTKAKFGGGYTMQEVDDFLDQITSDYNALFEENAGLKGKLKILADKIAEYRETEDVMRATLRSAQKTASDIVAEAESKREDILNALEEDIRARKKAYDDEIAVCRAQLANAREETANYLAAVRELTERQQSFLEQLPDLVQTPAPEEEPAPAAAQKTPDAPAAEREPAPEQPDAIEEMIAEEAKPDETAAEQQPETPPVSTGTSRIDFSNLKFGRDYEIK